MTIKHIYDRLFTVDYVLAYDVICDKDIDTLNNKLTKFFNTPIKLEYLGTNRGYCDQIERKDGLTVVIVLKEFNNSPDSQATLAHECFHASKFALEHKNIKLCDETEEVYAYNIDMLITAFLEERKNPRSTYLKRKFRLNNTLYGRKITQIIARQAKQTRKRTRI